MQNDLFELAELWQTLTPAEKLRLRGEAKLERGLTQKAAGISVRKILFVLWLFLVALWFLFLLPTASSYLGFASGFLLCAMLGILIFVPFHKQ